MRGVLCLALLCAMSLGCDTHSRGGQGRPITADDELFFRPALDRLYAEEQIHYAALGLPDNAIWPELCPIVMSRMSARLDRVGASYVTVDPTDPMVLRVLVFRMDRLELIRRVLLTQGRLTYHMPVPREEETEILSALEARFPGEVASRVKARPHGRTVAAADRERLVGTLARAATEPGLIPFGRVVLFSSPPGPGENPEYRLYIAEAEPLLEGEALDESTPLLGVREENREGWGLEFRLRDATRARILPHIEESPTQYVLMVIDGEVVCELNDRARFTFPSFSEEKASALGYALQTPPLPVPLLETDEPPQQAHQAKPPPPSPDDPDAQSAPVSRQELFDRIAR